MTKAPGLPGDSDATRQARSPILLPREGTFMSFTHHLPVSNVELHQLIREARLDLIRARSIDNAAGVARSERRMNALLDQLAKRIGTGSNERETPLRAVS